MIKRALNKLHYCLYIIENKAHHLFNKINPALLLFKIPFIKNKFKKSEDVDNPVEWYNDFWLNKETGFGLFFTGGWLVSIVFLFLFSLVNILFKLVNKDELINVYFFVAFGIISYLICYFMVFREDKYLEYFETFKYWNIKEKRTTVYFSVCFILASIVLFFGSLILNL